jgi:hypothetical protein
MQQHQVQLQPCACSSKSALKREVLESLFSFKFNKVERKEERERDKPVARKSKRLVRERNGRRNYEKALRKKRKSSLLQLLFSL